MPRTPRAAERPAASALRCSWAQTQAGSRQCPSGDVDREDCGPGIDLCRPGSPPLTPMAQKHSPPRAGQTLDAETAAWRPGLTERAPGCGRHGEQSPVLVPPDPSPVCVAELTHRSPEPGHFCTEGSTHREIRLSPHGTEVTGHAVAVEELRGGRRRRPAPDPGEASPAMARRGA